ncbi:MAG: hypothetical protein KDB25_03260 [Leucobacter sp.]|nr:hypothetical protein [Leucobacter sp.]
MNRAQNEQGLAAARQARTELYDTLGQLRERLDYAQRIDDAVARAGHRISAERRENPLGFALGVAAVAAAAGLAAWGIARAVRRALR